MSDYESKDEEELAKPPEEYSRPIWRHVLLWTAFALLTFIGVWTVLLPALEDSPEDPDAPEATEEPENTEESDE